MALLQILIKNKFSEWFYNLEKALCSIYNIMLLRMLGNNYMQSAKLSW